MRAWARRRAVLLAAAGAAILATLAPPWARAEALVHPYQIVTTDDDDITKRIAADLRKRLQTVLVLPPEALEPNQARARTIYIAIGPLALSTLVAREPDGVVISAYTSSQVWHAQLARAKPAQRAAYTAVYAEPSPFDQMRLIGLLYKRAVSVAAILSPDTAFLHPALRAASADITIDTFGEADDINRAMNRLAHNQVLLAVPDRSVYNNDNMRNILLSAYRHNQAVIGFSADMVKAGALASTYSEIDDINTQVGEIAAAYAATGELTPPQFPRYFNTVINEGVARSLRVPVDSAARHFARRPQGAK
ncbi:MAG: hypothetical protein V4582_16750 [Pseudomonadota bacterium]